MLESKSQAEMLRLLWAVCPAGGWFGLHDVFFVCSGGWQTWNLSNLLQSLEVGSVYMMFLWREQVHNTSSHALTSETKQE